MMRKTDSELSPAKRNGLKHRCMKCGYIENNAVASDPLKSAVGWLSGEVGRHAVTYEIKEGRLVPKTNTE
jgi:hypothetical protein